MSFESVSSLRNEDTAFALQTTGPSRGSDDHVEMAVPSPVGDVKIVSPISTFVLNTLTLKKKGCSGVVTDHRCWYLAPVCET